MRKQHKRRIIRRSVTLFIVGVLVFMGAMLLRQHQQVKDNHDMTPTQQKNKQQALQDSKKHQDTGIKTVEPTSSQSRSYDEQLKKVGYSGTALIVQNNQIILHKGYGKSRDSISNSVTTTYPLASITKNVTSIMLLKQMKLHDLSKDTKLSTFYPQIPNADNITLQDLWLMQSGLSNEKFSGKKMSQKEYVDDVVKRVKASEPMYHWTYNATNFIIISGILQKLTNQSYDDLLESQIQPEYRFENVKQFSENDMRPQGHDKEGNPINFNKQRFDREVGTGDVFGTAWTTYKFLKNENNGSVVPSADYKMLTQTLNGASYAGGLYHSEGGTVIGGHGMMQGFESTVYMTKDGKDAVLLFSNANNPDVNKVKARELFKDIRK
ncbi:serine hydrolase domain-containing protein [Weissella minor]|nr:serine hydrolase domain-containing protein [Weissella minor]